MVGLFWIGLFVGVLFGLALSAVFIEYERRRT